MIVAPKIEESGRGIILFLGVLPLLNGLTDFLSVGASRWLLRIAAPTEAHRRPRLLHWLWDAAAALATLALLAAGFIAFATFSVPQDGVPLIDLMATFGDIREHPESYWWLGFMVFTTLLPSLLHLLLAAYSAFLLIPTRLRLWIANELEAGAAGDEQRGKHAAAALIVLCALSLSLPAILMAEGAQWLWSGRADLRDGTLQLCEWFTLWLGQFA